MAQFISYGKLLIRLNLSYSLYRNKKPIWFKLPLCKDSLPTVTYLSICCYYCCCCYPLLMLCLQQTCDMLGTLTSNLHNFQNNKMNIMKRNNEIITTTINRVPPKHPHTSSAAHFWCMFYYCSRKNFLLLFIRFVVIIRNVV